MEYVYVAIGGMFGSLSRFLIAGRIAAKASTDFPISTLTVNITGAFLLGVVTATGFSSNLYTLVGTGYLGAFTTFSTFMYEGFNLLQDNDKSRAFIYMVGSLVLGTTSYVIGYALIMHI